MKALIAATLVAGLAALVVFSLAAPAAAAPREHAQHQQAGKITDFSARRYYRRHYYRHGYHPYYRPYYYARPYYYRPYPYYAASPFVFGFGLAPGW